MGSSDTSVKTTSEKPGASRPSEQSPLWNRESVAVLAMLTALGTVLRFLFLVRKPFWFDECFSVEVARLPWSDFCKLMWRREANMSLYYLLLRGWLHLGSSPFFIRSLSVILSLACLPAVFWLAGKMFGGRVALLATLLIAVNAYHIRYAQEARSYALFVLLATLSSGFFIAWQQEPSRRNRFAYAIASVLTVYAHLYALLLLAAQWLSVRRWWREDAGRRSNSSGRTSIWRQTWIWIGIAIAPLVIFAAKTGAGPIRWIPKPSLYGVLLFGELLVGNDGLFLFLIYVTACCIAFDVSRRKERKHGSSICSWEIRFLLIWLIFPVFIVVLLSLARPLFLGRYLIFCLPPFVILASAGITELRKIWAIMVAVIIVLLSMQGIHSYYDYDFDLVRDRSETATNYVLDHSRPGDAILFHIAEGRVPYEFFRSLRGANGGPEIVYPRHGDRLDYRDFSGRPSADLVRSLDARYSRVWVWLMSNEKAGRPDASTVMLEQVLNEGFVETEEEQYPQVELRLYSRR
jgi:mannosyltransferase